MAQAQQETTTRRFIQQCLVEGACPWPLGLETSDFDCFLSLTEEMEVQPILYSMLVDAGMEGSWPKEIVTQLRQLNRSNYVGFEFRVEEMVRVFSRLEKCGVKGILLKGVPFSYTIYRLPHHRPSSDVDIFIRREQLEIVTATMVEMGYQEVPDMLFGTVSQQKQFWRDGDRGFEHVFEFHTELNNRPLLAPLGMRHFETRSDTFVVGGITLLRAKAPEAFILASLHRFGHLPNDRRFLWLYDLKLLADGMSENEWDTVIRLAETSKCCRLIGESIRELERDFGCQVPDRIASWLGHEGRHRGELSAYYLRKDRSRRSDLWVAIRTLPRFSLRIRSIVQLVLPSGRYMRAHYSDEQSSHLWLLHCRRLWRMFFGSLFN